MKKDNQLFWIVTCVATCVLIITLVSLGPRCGISPDDKTSRCGNAFTNWIYDFQPLIAAFMAVIASAMTIMKMAEISREDLLFRKKLAEMDFEPVNRSLRFLKSYVAQEWDLRANGIESFVRLMTAHRRSGATFPWDKSLDIPLKIAIGNSQALQDMLNHESFENCKSLFDSEMVLHLTRLASKLSSPCLDILREDHEVLAFKGYDPFTGPVGYSIKTEGTLHSIVTDIRAIVEGIEAAEFKRAPDTLHDFDRH